MMLQIGGAAPDVQLTALNGRPTMLAESWRSGHTALLVFLRHLG
jgi:hypothetical protein